MKPFIKALKYKNQLKILIIGLSYSCHFKAKQIEKIIKPNSIILKGAISLKLSPVAAGSRRLLSYKTREHILFELLGSRRWVVAAK